jgi:hypothetical protein
MMNWKRMWKKTFVAGVIPAFAWTEKNHETTVKIVGHRAEI